MIRNSYFRMVSVLFFAFFLFVTAVRAEGLDLDKLPVSDVAQVRGLLKKLEPFIVERDKQKSLATLTFDELYAPLTADEKKFLKAFQDLDAKELNVRIPYRGIVTGQEKLSIVKGQKVRNKNKELKDLSVQFVPADVLKSFNAMMKAMKKDLGRRLYIESGYRSSAYQLYLFVFYLKNHAYSIRETVRYVALPGFSEHGWPEHQALDFINENGINGEENVKEFEDLPEYAWLLKNATKFGFVLSYPRDGGVGITFEPWHWRYGG